ncbi:MAG TPA: BolA/IbaG family iron-sulfur metabolism protein [Myxococcaceae bacterium]|nr:BolA/IbaG family iron-sulfur metabolism protein [Myxococcaceae bacterium]
MTVQERIETKLREALSPVHLEVENESRKHHVPPGSETHFKVVVASAAFKDMGLVDQHRHVHALLKEELSGGVHALALKTLTEAQWASEAEIRFRSPACLGGSKST